LLVNGLNRLITLEPVKASRYFFAIGFFANDDLKGIGIRISWQSQVKLNVVHNDIPFLVHNDLHPLAWNSPRIIKRKSTIASRCPWTTCVS
jgi:hypothetical protein